MSWRWKLYADVFNPNMTVPGKSITNFQVSFMTTQYIRDLHYMPSPTINDPRLTSRSLVVRVSDIAKANSAWSEINTGNNKRMHAGNATPITGIVSCSIGLFPVSSLKTPRFSIILLYLLLKPNFINQVVGIVVLP
jgi:hypothetical protein